jgi:hypothetical protein
MAERVLHCTSGRRDLFSILRGPDRGNFWLQSLWDNLFIGSATWGLCLEEEWWWGEGEIVVDVIYVYARSACFYSNYFCLYLILRKGAHGCYGCGKENITTWSRCFTKDSHTLSLCFVSQHWFNVQAFIIRSGKEGGGQVYDATEDILLFKHWG